ncbi:MAG: hypothetical protein F6K56_15410 [Moorea sp. SIO3G5]|nr:hypothetical protein [Moorena sp. SIO3G5]
MSIVSICATRTLREQQSAVSRQLYGTGHKPCDFTQHYSNAYRFYSKAVQCSLPYAHKHIK